MNKLPIKKIEELLKVRFGENFRDHMPLSSVLPIGLGGVGYMFVVANTTADLVDAAKIAIDNKLPYVAIGSGTATLVGESGFPGLVIKNNTNNIFRVGNSSKVVCDSGTSNSKVINSMASIGLGGIEFLDPIPGSIGGAIASRAELGSRRILDYVREMSVFDPDRGAVTNIKYNGLNEILNGITSSSLVYPPIILTITLQFASLAQEEIIRRLSIIKRGFNSARSRSMGYIFSQKLSEINFSKSSLKHLMSLNVTYDKILDRVYPNNSCTPTQLKEAIAIISECAKGFGIEASQKITYLGYYQGDDE